MLAYVVRHGESLANAGKGAGLNSGLSALGRRQAEAVTRRLAAVQITALYSSPFRRCLETADQIARAANCPIRLRPELYECHHQPPGTKLDTGLGPIDSILEQWPRACICPDHGSPITWPADDETVDDLAGRTRRFVTYVKGRWTSPDDAIVLVTHASPGARIIEAWLIDMPGPSFRFVVDNGGLTVLRHHEGVSSMLCMNEMSHLAGLDVPAIANYRADGLFKPTRP